MKRGVYRSLSATDSAEIWKIQSSRFLESEKQKIWKKRINSRRHSQVAVGQSNGLKMKQKKKMRFFVRNSHPDGHLDVGTCDSLL